MTLNSPVELNQFWAIQIKSWKQSGLSQAAYCRENDLLEHRFSYWKRKLSRMHSRTISKPSSNFIQLNPSDHHHMLSASPLVLHLPNEMRIEGIQADNLLLVTQLAEKIKGAPIRLPMSRKNKTPSLFYKEHFFG